MIGRSALFRLIPAAYSPFHPDGRLNLDGVPALAELYREAGLDTVFVCGTTGEFASMTTEERMELAARWAAESDGLRVLVHAGHPCQQDAIRLAAHARSIGAAGVSALAPFYFVPQRVEEVVAFLTPIAEAVAPLPFYYYEIPSMTGARIPPDAVFQALAAQIPNFAGLKFSSPDLVRFQACRPAAGPDLDRYFGYDEMLLAAVAVGASGAIGSTYNYIAPLYQAMLAAHDAGRREEAMRLQRTSVQLVDILGRCGGLSAGKAVMEMVGAPCGPVRLPLRPLSSADRQALFEALAGIDAFIRPLQRPV
ncbi:MAG: dihydrodipicolinate synthase family protein [Rhodothermales bacterium]|nr:dihydrodipicolinate synthase family protein [Rhodothermales bacterium]